MIEETLKEPCLSLTEKEKQCVKDAFGEGKTLFEHAERAFEAEGRMLSVTMDDLMLAAVFVSRAGYNATTATQKRMIMNVLKKVQRCIRHFGPFQELAEPDGPATAKSCGAAKNEGSASIYQLHIFLAEIKPKIWRRIQAPGDFSLAELHLAIQAAMGWENYHLYEFTVGRDRYSTPDDEYGDDAGDSKLSTLRDIAPKKGKKFTYTYDFGDDWLHGITVEKILPPEDGATYPRCLDGARACPPEDCGGAPGYENYVEAVTDPKHPEHEEFIAWRGPYDPERFDLAKANSDLKSFFKIVKKTRKKSWQPQ